MPEDDEPTTIIADRYELLGELGRGGMGTVHRARDVRLGRLVALKLVAPAFADDQDFQQRLLREAQALARINDPRVVTVYDSGLHEGRPWFVMELCTDGSLAERLTPGTRLDPAEVRQILGEVAGALAAIHGAGIVHRDLKPANVFRDGSHWKVGDFGIAAASGAVTITQTGMVMGTPEYWSPELAAADAETGPPADVYSLGCILYQALSGGPPFSGPNALRLGVKHAQEPVPPPPPEVAAADPDLAALVMRMLAKSPDERPTVEDLIAGVPVSSGAPPTVIAGAVTASEATAAPADAPPAPPPGGDSSPSERKGRGRMWVGIGIGAAVLAAIVAAVLAFALSGGGDDDPMEAGTFVADVSPELEELADSASEIDSLLAGIEDPSQLDDVERAASSELVAVEQAQGRVGEIATEDAEQPTKDALEDAVEAQRIYTAAVTEATTIDPADALARVPEIPDLAAAVEEEYAEFSRLAPEAPDPVGGLDLANVAGLERALETAVEESQPDPPPNDPPPEDPPPEDPPPADPPESPQVFTGAGFQSPTGNLKCNLASDTILICTRDNDGLNVVFDADTGSIVDSIGGPEPGGVTVPYGSDWEGGRFRCDSELEGLTCESFTAPGGFFLSRDEFTIL